MEFLDTENEKIYEYDRSDIIVESDRGPFFIIDVGFNVFYHVNVNDGLNTGNEVEKGRAKDLALSYGISREDYESAFHIELESEEVK